MVLEKLNVTDEIINGNPKYNITPNGDGTSKIELANEVVSDGTALNKLLFDKVDKTINAVDNVVAYKIPNLEQEVIGSEETTITSNIMINSVTPTWTSQNTLIGNLISGDMDTFDGITPTYKIYTNTTDGFYSDRQYSTDHISIRDSNLSYTSNDFLNCHRNTTYASGSVSVSYYTAPKQEVTYEFDMKVECKLTIYYGFGGNYARVSGSNDNENWTVIGDFETPIGNRTLVSSRSYRYYKINLKNTSTSNKTEDIGKLYFSNIIYNKNIYKNKYEFDNDLTNLANNQRVLMQSTNWDTIYTIGENSLNDILIDTLISQSKYYELVYNSSQNKFIAQEVRN